MLDLMPSLGTWRPAVSGERCAVATIVAAGGSVPRPLGTSMLVSEHGDVLGSLSGGCVEGAVVEAALEAMRDGGSRLESFGYSAEDAFAVGLTCGGELEVHIQPTGVAGLDLAALNAVSGGMNTASGWPSSMALIRRLDAAGGAVVVPDPAVFSAAGSQELSDLLGGDAGVIRAAAAQLEPLLRGGRAGLVRLAPAEGCGTVPEPEPITLFVESRLPAARMLIFGANDFGAALLPAGKLLGYDVTVCDARPAFSSQGRFLAADHLVTDWPHRYLAAESAAGRIDSRTVVCVLTHDPKFDIPLLETALALDLAYVGAMGSRRSHRQRIDGLLANGTQAEALERLHSPIGLDLGAVTPAEVAVSITAEILTSRAPQATSGRGSLKDGTGPIHHSTPETRTPDHSTPEHSKVTQWT
ncbi:XdhC family protein [Arthrobacter sp. MI7-26]|uniref:XdhC family protein n=1 Tax=Arthrobacter sp. MI7-26 TaxID=2993653 RepID=UPI002248FD71|nr:XdhC/CoxI family protein [Arthrobacter sp. MI7-26]MCX2747855.1 XdhC family protein [Arthrobacter sp. MI7-26]